MIIDIDWYETVVLWYIFQPYQPAIHLVKYIGDTQNILLIYKYKILDNI